MQLFLVFLSFIILLTDEGHSWRVVKKNSTEALSSTTSTHNYNPVPNNDPRRPNSGSDTSYDQNFPLLWQIETVDTVDVNKVTNNPEIFNQVPNEKIWRLQPADDTDFNNHHRLPKVVLLKLDIEEDDSKPRNITMQNGNPFVEASFRELSTPSINNVMHTYNPYSLEAPIYIKMDPSMPVTLSVNNGKIKSVFHVCRVHF